MDADTIFMDTDGNAKHDFTSVELQHYQRQMLLPEVGMTGQRALKCGRVLVVGAGALGSPVLLYLAAAGVGTLGVVDFDSVDRTNLHRQILFDVASVGLHKLDAARKRLLALNPHIRVETYPWKLDGGRADGLIAGYDVVVDATDNFTARYVINDACVRTGRPDISASILRFEGQLSVFVPGEGPCYRCLYPEPPPPGVAPSCAEAGVIGSLPGVLGALQATEAIKLLLGQRPALLGRLLTFDALNMEFRSLQVARNEACPVCSGRAAAPRIPRPAGSTVSVRDLPVSELRQWRDSSARRPLVLDVRQEREFRVAHIAGAALLPLDQLAGSASTLPHELPIVCVCQSGKRSRLAAEMLLAMGFSDVYSLEGGMGAWNSAAANGGDDPTPTTPGCAPCGCGALPWASPEVGSLDRIAEASPRQ